MISDIGYTVFADVMAQHATPYTTSWDALCQSLVDAPQFASKQQCPLLKLCTFGNERTQKGSLRHDANVLTVAGLVGDYDAEVMSVEDAASKFETYGIEAFFYTSASHTVERPRWRVLLPLSVAHAPGDYGRLMAVANEIVGGVLAAESFTLSQSFYFGRVAGVIYETRRVEGVVCIDEIAAGFAGIGLPVRQAASGGSGNWADQARRDVALSEVTPEVIGELRSALGHLAAQGMANRGAHPEWDRIRQAMMHLGDDGRDLFVEFSALGDSDNKRSTAYERFYGAGGGDRSTYKTVFAMAQESGWSNPRSRGALDDGRMIARTLEVIAGTDSYEALLDEIKFAGDSIPNMEKIAARISTNRVITDAQRKGLAAAMKFGTRISVEVWRKLCALPVTERFDDAYGWMDGWVYLTLHDRFYNRTLGGAPISSQGFNAMFNRLCPPAEGKQPNAAADAVNYLNVPVVSKHMYAPALPQFFEYRGEKCINSYRPESVPVARPYATQEESDAVSRVLSHISMLCGDQYENMLAWIAHNVQHPSVKIRFVPLIKGTYGDGKSFFAKLLMAVMGAENVNNISNDEIDSKFTDWAWGASVGFIEELKMAGKGKHTISDRVKPYITNDDISVLPKGLKAFGAINTMNYIAATNYDDAVPIQTDDRRWWVIFTPFNGAAELIERIGDKAQYFEPLFAAVEEYVPALRYYFETYPIPTSFKPNGDAPLTDAKAVMREAADSGLVRDARELIELGSVGFCKDVVCTSYFTKAISDMRSERPLHSKSLSKLLESMGYVRFKKLRWERKPENIYVISSETFDEDKIRKLLDDTLISGVNFGQ